MSMKPVKKFLTYPIGYPQLSVGSKWVVTTRDHHNFLREIVGVSSNNVSVFVKTLKGPKQHANKVYTVAIDAFLRHNRPA